MSGMTAGCVGIGSTDSRGERGGEGEGVKGVSRGALESIRGRESLGGARRVAWAGVGRGTKGELVGRFLRLELGGQPECGNHDECRRSWAT